MVTYEKNIVPPPHRARRSVSYFNIVLTYLRSFRYKIDGYGHNVTNREGDVVPTEVYLCHTLHGHRQA